MGQDGTCQSAIADIRERIVNEARLWIGVPFRHHGRSRQGVDCAGLLYVVYSNVIGLPEGDFREYCALPETPFVFRSITRYARRIAPDTVLDGDIKLISFGGSSTHFGITTDRGIVQANPAMGVIEHRLSVDHIADRVVACFRMKGLDTWLV